MAGETIVTVVGNLTADPEMRYTQNGLPVANFTIASTPRHFDKAKNEWVDDDALFLRASIWRDFAENVAASLTKGTRVIATGRLKQRSYEDKEGNKRTVVELEVDEIGPSLRYAQAAVQRVQRDASQTRQQPSAYQSEQGDAWATPQQYEQAMAPQGGAPQQSQQPAFDEPWATPGSANSYDETAPF
nr:MAG TPA: Single stranded DNA binding protein [Caudoviricetes sp.]